MIARPRYSRTVALGLTGFVLAGCEGPMRLSSGQSGLRIHLVASPKRGYVPPRESLRGAADPYATPGAAPAETGAYEQVDYLRLDGIVAFVEPLTGQAAAAPASAAVEVADWAAPAESAPAVASVGGSLTVRNRGSAPVSVYSVSEGNDCDLGMIAAGGAASATLRAPGLVELWCEGCDEPCARVFVAPNGWVGAGRHRSVLRFSDLPPGGYRVTAWHARLPGESREVTLRPNEVTEVTLMVGVDSLAATRMELAPR